MKVIEFMDASLARFMKGDADETNKARQAIAETAAKKCARHRGFNNNEDTYFVCTDEKNKRYTVVLGWDHAILLVKKDEQYFPMALLAHGANPTHPAYGDIEDLNPLGKGFGSPVTFADDSVWTEFDPPDFPIERVITYGVSSCSFSVLYSAPSRKFIAISHMSGEPAIPVGFIFDAVLPNKKREFFASVFPQGAEALKFVWNRSLRRLQKQKAVLLFRGRIPDPEAPEIQFPQFTHPDLGINLSGKEPRLEGLLGLEKDLNYSRIIPLHYSMRLKAFAKPEAMSDGVLFEAPGELANELSGGRIRALRIRFAELGHPLSSQLKIESNLLAQQKLNKGYATLWRITDKLSNRQIFAERIQLNRTEKMFQYTFAIRSGATTSFSTDSPNLSSCLDMRAIDQVRPRAADKNIQIVDKAVIAIVKEGSAWTITGLDQIIDVTAKEEISIKPYSRVIVKSKSEESDIQADIVQPLLRGDFGFGPLHVTLAKHFVKLFGTRKSARPYLSIRQSALEVFESNAETFAMLELGKKKEAQILFARLLGHFLSNESHNHPYAEIVESVVHHFRFELDMPLDAPLLGASGID